MSAARVAEPRSPVLETRQLDARQNPRATLERRWTSGGILAPSGTRDTRVCG